MVDGVPAIGAIPRTRTLAPLGVLLDMSADTLSAVQERLVKAGKAFWGMGDFLKARHVPLHERWDAFAEKIIPVALYNSDLWVMGQKTFDLLVAWETAFLRRILGFRKALTESWVSFLQRSGRAAIQLYTKAGHELLVVRWARSVYMLAGSLVYGRREPFFWEGSGFFKSAILWRCRAWWEALPPWQARVRQKLDDGGYSLAHHTTAKALCRTWESILCDVLGVHWWGGCYNHVSWKANWPMFLGGVALKYSRGKVAHLLSRLQALPRDQPVVRKVDRPELRIFWDCATSFPCKQSAVPPAVTFFSDNLVLVNVINGAWAPWSKEWQGIRERVVDRLHSLYIHGAARPACVGGNWIYHLFQFREFNRHSDELATAAVVNGKNECKHHPASWWSSSGLKALKCFSDGGRRGTQCGAGSVLLGLWNKKVRQHDPGWTVIVEDQIVVKENSSVMLCEAVGLEKAVERTCNRLCGIAVK